MSSTLDVPVRTAALFHGLFDDALGACVRAGVASADGGDPVPAVAAVLEERDPAALGRWAATLPEAEAARVRELFVGFGTCSTDEPLADLCALGLVPEDAA